MFILVIGGENTLNVTGQILIFLIKYQLSCTCYTMMIIGKYYLEWLLIDRSFLMVL
jgi:hypothetical protein